MERKDRILLWTFQVDAINILLNWRTIKKNRDLDKVIMGVDLMVKHIDYLEENVKDLEHQLSDLREKKNREIIQLKERLYGKET